MCALLASCVDQPKEVASYRRIIDVEAPLDAPVGDSLALAEALRLTIARNERLSIEGENYLQALIDRKRTAASILPTIDAFGNFTFRDRGGGGTDGGGGDGGGSNDRSTLFDAGVGGQYTLLTGLTDFNRIGAAELTIEQRHWLLLDLREAIVLEAARAYYAVLIAERLVEVISSSLLVQEERLREIRGRQAVGFARPLDVVQIESQASETRVLLLDAQNSVATARAGLTLLTGLDVSRVRLSDRFDSLDSPRTIDELYDTAIEHRQDLGAAAAAAQSARVTVDAQIGRYYPTISVNLDYFLTRDTVPTDRDWTGLLSVNIPIFSAGRIDADVRTAWSFFRQAVLGHSLTRREIRRDVEVAFSDLAATRARIIELRNQLRAGQEALRQADASYGAGLGTNLERIVAQDLLLSAQVRLAREEFSEKIAYLAAMRAAGLITRVGTGSPPDAVLPPTKRDVPDSPFITLPPDLSAEGALIPPVSR